MLVKRGLALILLVAITSIIASTAVLGVLSCAVRQSACSGSEVKLLGMNATSDTHAELANQSSADYPFYVCCKDSTDVATIASTCTGSSTTFLRLSGATDAHVEKGTLSNVDYPNRQCISSGTATFNCDYQSSCSGNQACLLSISADTDAHVGNCSAYSTQVCCNMTYTNTAPSITSVSDAPDPVKGGATVTLTPAGISDDESNSLTLYCSDNSLPTSGNDKCTGGTRTGGSPYSFTCTFAAETDDTSHTVYCRVYDGEYYSGAVSTSYTTDSTPPAAVTIGNVDGDSSSPYWDTSNNSQTIIQSNRPDSGMLCRWSTSDQVYSAISGDNECSVGDNSVSCNLGLVGQTSSISRYISCKDAVGNEQSTGQNTDVTFGVDWTEPTTSVSGYGSYYLPGKQVQFHEADNTGTPSTILTWHCEPTVGCTPATEIDNLENVSFSTRGTNYLRWFSKDAAQNQQPTQTISVEINSLPVIANGDMQYGIGGAPYTGKNGQRIYFYCDGTDANGAVDGNSGYSAKIWLKHQGEPSWIVSGSTMTWSAIDGRFFFDHLLDESDDIYNKIYDMTCEITDNLGEKANNTKASIFTVINTPPYGDNIYVSNASAQKYSNIRWYCSGADADIPTHQESTLTAHFWLRTQGAGSWNRLEDVPMAWDGTDHYVDYQVVDNGGQHYDAQCQFNDGVDASTLYQEFQTEYITADDWDHDGVSDATDRIGGTGGNMNASGSVSLLVGGSQVNTSTGVQTVTLKDNGDDKVLVQFLYNFTNSTIDTPLVLINRTLVNGRSAILINGLDGVNKTINLPKVTGSSRICVKNSGISSFSDISANCNAGDETIFDPCNGQTIGGIRCTDMGTYFKIDGLTHSAATEFGTSRLSIWSEATLMQPLQLIAFKANYSNISSGDPITDGNCQIWFTDTGWTNMNYVAPLWNYTKTFSSEANYLWKVNCTSPTFDHLNVSDTVGIFYPAYVPEFGTWALLLALGVVAAGLTQMRGKSLKRK
jgi:hypothetical protein